MIDKMNPYLLFFSIFRSFTWEWIGENQIAAVTLLLRDMDTFQDVNKAQLNQSIFKVAIIFFIPRVPSINRILKHLDRHPQSLKNQMRLQNDFVPLLSRLTCEILSSILRFVCVSKPPFYKTEVSLWHVEQKSHLDNAFLENLTLDFCSYWTFSQATL